MDGLILWSTTVSFGVPETNGHRAPDCARANFGHGRPYIAEHMDVREQIGVCFYWKNFTLSSREVQLIRYLGEKR